MRVSIALGTYNGGQYLEEQLNSFLTQTRQFDEIVICDDCSTDSTWHILTKFKERVVEKKIILKQNKEQLGVMKNFQQALSLCCGDIILLSDQDDIWLENKVQYFVDYFTSHNNINLFFSNAFLFLDDYYMQKVNAKTLFQLLSFDTKTQEIFRRRKLGLEISQLLGRVSGFTIGVRKTFLEELLPFSEEHEYFIHDRQMVLSAIASGSIDFTDECLVKYRIHKAQTSNIIDYLHKNKLNNLPPVLPPLSEDVISFLTIKGYVFDAKYSFCRYRINVVKKTHAPLLMLLSVNKYIKHYGKYFYLAIKYDIQQYFIKIRNRLLSIFRNA